MNSPAPKRHDESRLMADGARPLSGRGSEHEKARQWRERHRLSRQALADLTGYSVLAIYWMERGQSARGGPIWPNIWQRYKHVCHSVEKQLESGEFNW